ncbi:hypothetical protein D3C72_1871900 [compost metagenome]
MNHRKRCKKDGDCERPTHAKESNRQAGKYTCHYKTNALCHTHEPISIGVLLFRHEQCHSRRKSNVTHILHHTTYQDSSSKQPEHRTRQGNKSAFREKKVEHAGEREHYKCNDTRQYHDTLLLVVVDDCTEYNTKDCDKQHV